MDKLRIAMITPEVAPLARTGGLGDVLGALPPAIAESGHEVVVFLPRYGSISTSGIRIAPAGQSPTVNLGGKTTNFTLERLVNEKSKVTTYLIGNRAYFERTGLFIDPRTGTDYSDNDERFAMFSLAALESLRVMDWVPDVIHLHDWQTALVPAFLRTRYVGDRHFARAKTVLTIHNLGYQGLFPGERFAVLGLPEGYFYPVTGPVEFFGKVNFLKAGIAQANRVTTVSESYAREIQSSNEFGRGLEGVLAQRGRDLVGILNGVDYSIWSPARDQLIPRRYHLRNLSGKRVCRTELVRESGLPIRDHAPLVGMVTRLTEQKGFDLIAAAVDRLFSRNIQMIILGAGDQKYHELLTEWQKKFPDKLRVFLTFDDALAHRIEAGADVFLMPSHYEPSGLNQMYSLKYGTVPIVRRTGGLADSVQDFDPVAKTGNGFVFDAYEPKAMLEALDRALAVFPKKRVWNQLIKAGMSTDFSWAVAAKKYCALYESLASH